MQICVVECDVNMYVSILGYTCNVAYLYMCCADIIIYKNLGAMCGRYVHMNNLAGANKSTALRLMNTLST